MRSVRLLGRLGPALLGSAPFLVISWFYQAGPNVHHSFQAALCTSHDARVGVRLMFMPVVFGQMIFPEYAETA